MKVLHHGYVYPNYCKCSSCGCEFIYDDNETSHVLDLYNNNTVRHLVWTMIQCPECKNDNMIYNYKGKINKVRIYDRYDYCGKYQEIDFDENTMERK